jgi:phosphoribosyl 1,2-cyclic phosphate phosphodiesterase
MKIEFLGTGGAITIPQPGCECQVCSEARKKGIPYSRTGPSLFIHGPDILIDTPEEIKQQLNRSKVTEIKACFYSHWHPDHVMGRRVWEMNNDWRNWPPKTKQTDIYLPEHVAHDFRKIPGIWDHFNYLRSKNLIRLIELTNGEKIIIGNTQIFPVPLAEDYVYGFLVEENKKRIFIGMDELHGWDPPTEICGLDLAILPMGIVEFDPFTDNRLIPENHPLLKREATFIQTLHIIRKLNASLTVIIHIEEPDNLSYNDLKKLEKQLQTKCLNIIFAYDTMIIDI